MCHHVPCSNSDCHNLYTERSGKRKWRSHSNSDMVNHLWPAHITKNSIQCNCRQSCRQPYHRANLWYWVICPLGCCMSGPQWIVENVFAQKQQQWVQKNPVTPILDVSLMKHNTGLWIRHRLFQSFNQPYASFVWHHCTYNVVFSIQSTSSAVVVYPQLFSPFFAFFFFFLLFVSFFFSKKSALKQGRRRWAYMLCRKPFCKKGWGKIQNLKKAGPLLASKFWSRNLASAPLSQTF